MSGTLENPKVSPAIVKANPEQDLPTGWRWGPRWTLDDRSGVWAVDKIYHVAVRLEDDETADVLTLTDFRDELEEARDAESYAVQDRALETIAANEQRAQRYEQRRTLQSARLRLRKAVREGRLGGPDDGAAEGVPA